MHTFGIFVRDWALFFVGICVVGAPIVFLLNAIGISVWPIPIAIVGAISAGFALHATDEHRG